MEHDLAAVVAFYRVPFVFPPRSAFFASGHGALYSALQLRHGGISAVASRAGLSYRKGPAGLRYRGLQIPSRSALIAELEALADAGVCAQGCVPMRSQLAAAGRLGLYTRLCRLGGLEEVARLTGLKHVDGRRKRAPEDKPLDPG